MERNPARTRPPLTCVYVTDRGFLACTCFSIISLAARASVPLDIHVLYADSDVDARVEAEHYLAGQGIAVRFTTLAEEAFAGLRRPTSLPLATYGRLLMDAALPISPERVLYLDGDTLVDIDVAPLRDLPLGDDVLGAVLDIGRVLIGRREEAQRRLDLGPDGDYFNAGVLLIDWAAWRAGRIGETTLEALARTPGRFTQNDQCALNYVCRGRWRLLDPIWNYQPANVVHDDRPEALFHFLGGRKPWAPRQNRHPARFVQRYRALIAGSPWAGKMARPGLPLPGLDALRLAKQAVSTRTWTQRSLYRRTMARIACAVRH